MPPSLSGSTPADSLTLVQALIFGVVQGVTEYLPVSSSAHLILLPKFLGIRDPGLVFDVFLHLGTLLATLIYFRAEWISVLRSFPFLKGSPRSQVRESETSWEWIALATIPALLAAALGRHWIQENLRQNAVQAAALAVGGLLLFVADRFGPRKFSLGQIGGKLALGVGFAQCLALIPGMSRSGSTLLGARLLGVERESAAKFSFLISTPITAAAVVFELRHWQELVDGVGQGGVLPAIAGAVAAFLSGWLAIDGLLRLLKRFGFGFFAIYRLLLAGTVVAVLGV
jgi:undecaprenyl-diphosphatase